jgi:protein TonB
MTRHAPLSWGLREPVLSWPGRRGRNPSNHPAVGQPTPKAKSPNRRLIITLLVSLGLHAAAVTAVLLLLHAGVPPAVDTAEKPTEVELVMVEHKGDQRPTAAPAPSPPAPPAPTADKPSEVKATPPVQAQPDATEPIEQPAAPPQGTSPPPVQQAKSDPAKTPDAAAESQPAPKQPTPAQPTPAQPAPAQPAAEAAPTISLQGTDSPSEARAFGDRVIPAKPDAVFHNRPPEYPEEAALSGQQGTVVVLIHVSPAGTAAGVDLLRSSGYVLLDRAAQQAVLRWRFLPAVKDGQPVASDMTMGFVFDDK